jgi:hypothetical protein
MNTTGKALGLIANADTKSKLQDIARWVETHHALSELDKAHIREAIKGRMGEVK